MFSIVGFAKHLSAGLLLEEESEASVAVLWLLAVRDDAEGEGDDGGGHGAQLPGVAGVVLAAPEHLPAESGRM